jgi:hypothetical protein
VGGGKGRGRYPRMGRGATLPANVRGEGSEYMR